MLSARTLCTWGFQEHSLPKHEAEREGGQAKTRELLKKPGALLDAAVMLEAPSVRSLFELGFVIRSRETRDGRYMIFCRCLPFYFPSLQHAVCIGVPAFSQPGTVRLGTRERTSPSSRIMGSGKYEGCNESCRQGDTPGWQAEVRQHTPEHPEPRPQLPLRPATRYPRPGLIM